MGVIVKEFGVTVPGNLVRKFDGSETTLTVTAEQARSLRDSCDLVLKFVEQQQT